MEFSVKFQEATDFGTLMSASIQAAMLRISFYKLLQNEYSAAFSLRLHEVRKGQKNLNTLPILPLCTFLYVIIL